MSRRCPRQAGAVDREGAELLYRQVIGIVSRRILDGALAPGDKAPSVRELAAALKVTHVTAWRALKSLVDAGVLAVQRGRGAYVSGEAVARLRDAGPGRAGGPAALAASGEPAASYAPGPLPADEIRRRRKRAGDGRTVRDLFSGFAKDTAVPLHAQVFRCVADAVAKGRIRRGDRLPSLQETGRLLAISVTTVAYAFRELQRSGIIEPSSSKGYFVCADVVTGRTRVFLLFDEFNAFKEELFNAFRLELGDRAQIELFFHHYRRDVFEDLLRHAWGRYHFYVMIPHPERAAQAALDRFDPREVLLIDQRHGADPRFPIICQDFEGDTYRGLQSAADAIRAYETFVLVDPDPGSVHHLGPFAEEIKRGFLRFCGETGLPWRVVRGVPQDVLKPGVACLVIGEEDLVALVQAIVGAGLRVGADVGVISYNESLLKQVIGGGISTLSTDFARMGAEAARCISEQRTHAASVNPSKLTIRTSLRRG